MIETKHGQGQCTNLGRDKGALLKMIIRYTRVFRTQPRGTIKKIPIYDNYIDFLNSSPGVVYGKLCQ